MAKTPPAKDQKTRILQAASHLLASQGYAAATINQVAARAGVSRGLVHYYFKNKEDMLARVVRANMEEVLDLVGAMFARSRSAGQLAREITQALRGVVTQRPEFFKLVFEFWAAGRQRPAVARELRVLYSQFRQAIAQRLEQARQQGVISPGLPLEGLSAVLAAIFDGLGLQMLTEPKLAADQAVWKATEGALARLLGA